METNGTTALTELNRTKDIAKFTGIPIQAFRKSRMTGQLYGVKAPPHVKVGRVVFYRKKDIEDWLDGLNDSNCEGL